MVEYVDSLDGVTTQHLMGGFFAGWRRAVSPEEHLKLLENSHHVVLAIDHETRNVIGFITAISDGVLSAYIPLLEVLRSYQHCGVGQELCRRMIDKLSELYMVDLLCDESLASFYQQFGMMPAHGMMIRNFG